jgi:predicted amidohydrolase YtcJ
MQLSDVDGATPNPAGGDFLKDGRQSRPACFRETALAADSRRHRRTGADAGRARAHAPGASSSCASAEVVSKGVTSFQDAGSSLADVDLMKQMIDEGKIGEPALGDAAVSNEASPPTWRQYKTIDYGDGFLTVRAIKKRSTARSDRAARGCSSRTRTSPATAAGTRRRSRRSRRPRRLALEARLSAVRARDRRSRNRETLDIFERRSRAATAKACAGASSTRQHLSAADIPRFGKLGVIASMQGVHCTSDAPYVLARLGPGAPKEGAYVWQKLMQSGALVSNGTDARSRT